MLDTEAFLRQEVESASPAKLRLMLIQKAHGLVNVIAQLWGQGKASEAKQWVIRVQDIFSELLEGVVDPNHELAVQQSDLYVFLLKLLIESDQTQDIASMESIANILDIEKTSWSLLVRKEQEQEATRFAPATSGSDSLDLQA